jgi:hypothetical protein
VTLTPPAVMAPRIRLRDEPRRRKFQVRAEHAERGALFRGSLRRHVRTAPALLRMERGAPIFLLPPVFRLTLCSNQRCFPGVSLTVSGET